jgi:hypothetical protein
VPERLKLRPLPSPHKARPAAGPRAAANSDADDSCFLNSTFCSFKILFCPSASSPHPSSGHLRHRTTSPFYLSHQLTVPSLRCHQTNSLTSVPMASQMEWSHEYCLFCDRQIAEGGAYCSQACRLADLEKAGPKVPSNLSSSASSSSSSTSGHAFYLPPAVNFSALKTSSSSRGFDLGPSAHQQYYYHSTTNGSYFAPSAPATTGQQQQRSLTPSSSRSSLASAASQSTTNGISYQAAQQLNGYVRSFDQVRDMRRRYHQY